MSPKHETKISYLAIIKQILTSLWASLLILFVYLITSSSISDLNTRLEKITINALIISLEYMHLLPPLIACFYNLPWINTLIISYEYMRLLPHLNVCFYHPSWINTHIISLEYMHLLSPLNIYHYITSLE